MDSTMMDFPLTLTAILEHAGRIHGASEIVSRLPDRTLHREDFATFRRRARALAESLTRLGLGRGDRVATLMWNHYAHVEAYFGVPAAGGVTHTLNLRLHPDDIGYIVDHAGDRFLIVDDVLLPLYEKFRDEVRFEQVFVVPLTGKPVPAPYRSYEDLLAGATGDFVYPTIGENEPCGMCYTSGTTGRPKGVVYSHRSTVLHSFCIATPNVFGLGRRQTVMPVVPMFHVNAWGLPYASLLTGSRLVMPGPYLDPENLCDLFARERVTLAAGVPSLWSGVLDLLTRERAKYPTAPGLRMLIGGSACPESMIEGFDKLGIKVEHAWGMTETSPVGTTGALMPQAAEGNPKVEYRYRSTQGLPLPLVETRVVDDLGEVAWDGHSVGELQVRGPWIAGAYFRPDGNPQSWTQDGWFRTGDVVSIDPAGYIKITDRTKDLIKSGGEWIGSVDLENALMGHEAVREAAVIAVAHPKWGERPLACVVLKPGASASADELKTHLTARFASWWVPDAVEFVKEIPKTSTGKFQKSRLREMFKDYRLAS